MSKKIKLSSTQLWVLEKLSKGEILNYINGINAKCFFSGANVSWPTIYKLEEIGAIKRIDKQIVLTELGKTIKP